MMRLPLGESEGDTFIASFDVSEPVMFVPNVPTRALAFRMGSS